MEFVLKSEKKIETKTRECLAIAYKYRFKGTDESNKSVLNVSCEQALDLNEGAVIQVEFTNTQTKIESE